MAKVRVTNNSSANIVTITGGWLMAYATTVIEAWEAPILSDLYGNKVFVSDVVEEPKTTKKTKK